MDDNQLRDELSTFGVNVGPINDSTRDTYTRLLAKKKGGSPSRSSSRKSYSPARTSTPKAKPSPTKRNASPQAERIVPVSPPRRTPPSTRRSSPPPQVERPVPISPPRRTPPSTRRASPPRQAERPVPVLPPRGTPPLTRRASPPRQAERYVPVLPPRGTPPLTQRRPSPPATTSYNKIDFDNSVPDDDDDDHMEFSKYIPRSNLSKRPHNTSLTSSFLNNTKKKMTAVHPLKGFQINPTFCLGLAATCAFLAYALYPEKIHESISSTSDYFNSAIMAGFKYAIMPFLILGVVFALGCAIYYGFQAYAKNKTAYEEKKRKMIKDILKAVYNAPANGIPVKQLRDRMVPAYKRTKDELLLWNECEDFVKTYETRVRAEERANHNGDEIVEHFVWVASTLNQDLEDD